MRIHLITKITIVIVFIFVKNINDTYIRYQYSIPILDASASYVNTSCFRYKDGLNLVDNLIKNINMFSSTGKDPRVPQSQVGPESRMFGPVAQLTNNEPRKYSNYVLDSKTNKDREIDAIAPVRKLVATTFFMSPCLAVTNYHAVFGNSRSPNGTDFSVTLTAAGESGTAHAVAFSEPPSRERPANDWSILQMDNRNCIGFKVGWFRMGVLFPDDGMNIDLFTSGYPVDKLDNRNPNQLGKDYNVRLMGVDSVQGNKTFLLSGAV